jgi:hypothetical protein
VVTTGIALLLVMGVLAAVLAVSKPEPVSAGTVSFSQCNDRNAGVLGAPLTVTCSVNIVNNITPNGNSSTVTFNRVCTLNPCSGSTVNSSDVVNEVHQCNGSNNVGGSTTTCHVTITNYISVNAPAAPSAITVNQCIGSGAGGGTNMTACLPSSQGSPTVTQCNGSGNGGGGKMTCNASGTTSSTFPVTVHQCNGSENGGGSQVTCTVTMTTNLTAAPATTPTQAAGGSTGHGTTESTTPVATATATQPVVSPTTSPGAGQTPQSGASPPPQAALQPPNTGDGGLLPATERRRQPVAEIGLAAALLLVSIPIARWRFNRVQA